MEFELGTGPDSWGVWFDDDPRQPPFDQFVAEAAQAGYATIELGPYGYLPTDPVVLRRLLDTHQLGVSGGFVMGDLHSDGSWDALRGDVEKTCALLSAVGAGFLVIIAGVYTDLFTGELVSASELSEPEWDVLVENCHRIADVATGFGLRSVFHPHAQTPVEFEWQIEKFLERTDPTKVGLCLDTGHHAYCGGDVASFMLRHHRRIPYLHIKSVDRRVMAEVQANGLPFATAVKMGAFTEPQLGDVDFARFREVLEEVGFKGIGIVEQDMYPVEFDRPLPIAISTRESMRELGYFGPSAAEGK